MTRVLTQEQKDRKNAKDRERRAAAKVPKPEVKVAKKVEGLVIYVKNKEEFDAECPKAKAKCIALGFKHDGGKGYWSAVHAFAAKAGIPWPSQRKPKA